MKRLTIFLLSLLTCTILQAAPAVRLNLDSLECTLPPAGTATAPTYTMRLHVRSTSKRLEVWPHTAPREKMPDLIGKTETGQEISWMFKGWEVCYKCDTRCHNLVYETTTPLQGSWLEFRTSVNVGTVKEVKRLPYVLFNPEITGLVQVEGHALTITPMTAPEEERKRGLVLFSIENTPSPRIQKLSFRDSEGYPLTCDMVESYINEETGRRHTHYLLQRSKRPGAIRLHVHAYPAPEYQETDVSFRVDLGTIAKPPAEKKKK